MTTLKKGGGGTSLFRTSDPSPDRACRCPEPEPGQAAAARRVTVGPGRSDRARYRPERQVARRLPDEPCEADAGQADEREESRRSTVADHADDGLEPRLPRRVALGPPVAFWPCPAHSPSRRTPAWAPPRQSASAAIPATSLFLHSLYRWRRYLSDRSLRAPERATSRDSRTRRRRTSWKPSPLRTRSGRPETSRWPSPCHQRSSRTTRAP